MTRLPRTKKHNDSIMVVVDKLSKETHFIPVKYTYKDANIADVFMKEIFWVAWHTQGSDHRS